MMDNNTCRIVGTIRKTSGAPAANETIHIVQDNIRRAWDGAALPVVQHVTADGNGVVDFDLIPGHYRLVWQDATAQAQHRLYVPDAPFVWLADAAAGRESRPYRDGTFTRDGLKITHGYILQPPA